MIRVDRRRSRGARSSRLNVARYSLWKLGRLQPSAYCGVSLSRTTGSCTCAAQVRAARRSASLATGTHAVEVRGQRERELDEAPGWPARAPRSPRDARISQRSRPRHRRVRLGQAPDRRALEDGQVLDVRRDLRDDLHGGGAGADDRHALAARSMEWSQRAVCIVAPPKSSTPGCPGVLGWLSTPVAPITKRAVISSPAAVVSRQRCVVLVERRAASRACRTGARRADAVLVARSARRRPQLLARARTSRDQSLRARTRTGS